MKIKCHIFLWVCIMLILGGDNNCQSQEIKKDSLQVKQSKLVAEEDSVKMTTKTPNGAMIRSAIFPGWGQWYNKKKFKAVVVFCAETGLLANAIYLNQQLVKSSEYYEREFYINNRNISVWWLVGVTLFSMADAFVDAHLADFDESPILSFVKITPILSHRNSGLKISFCSNF